jgi:uncharacterized membrane protein YdbT with pleckstrin-like domain
MAYFDTVKRTNEQLVFQGKIHWVVYLTPIVIAVFGCGLMIAMSSIPGIGLFILFFALIAWVRAFYFRRSTEIVITDKRVLVKKYLIARQTQEMNLSKVETVDLRQSILQRLLGTGYIMVVGAGGSLEPIGPVSTPVQMRNAIVVG